MKAYVDKETCTGCELCTQICSEVFSMNDEGVAVAIEGDVPKDAEEDCQEAADSCPVDAIEVK